MRGTLLGWLLTALLIGCGVTNQSAFSPGNAASDEQRETFEGPVPRANCGPGSMPELQMQGEPRPVIGSQCNLELIGQYQEGEGSNWQDAWYDRCFYYGTFDTAAARRTQRGTVVVDVADPTHPVGTTVLDTVAMLNPHESLKTNEKRGLLAAGESAGPGFDVYDLKSDCAHPQLMFSGPLETVGHEGNWSPDGLTYWLGGAPQQQFFPVDVTDPTLPEAMLSWNINNSGTGTTGALAHGLSISDDGTRGYFTVQNGFPLGVTSTPPSPTGSPNGLAIADTSDVQFRRPNAEIRVISTLFWTDGSSAQMTIPVTIQGKPYVIFSDETMAGAARIIDISDEKHPFIVSKLKIEATFLGAFLGPGNSHYCSVPQRLDPGIVACGYWNSGIRVFDIRDPYLPKEIAYFNPAPIPGKALNGSSNGASTASDSCTNQIRLIAERGELWSTCGSNEFIALKFTNGAWPFRD